MLATAPEIRAKDGWFASCHPEHKVTMTSAEQLIAVMDEDGIDRAVVLGWPFVDPALCAEMNDVVAAAAVQFPDRLIGFGVIQPNDKHAMDEIYRCRDLGLVGIGELNSDAQAFGWDDWRLLEPLVRVSVDLGLLWNIHCSEPVGHVYAGKGMATPNLVFDFLQHANDLKIICSHLGGGLPLYAHMPEVKEICQRVWFDTAAVPFLFTDSIYAAIIDLVGNRFMFGSDFPLLRSARYLPSFANLGPAQKDAICWRVADGLFQV
jgi:uncharacterized protein